MLGQNPSSAATALRCSVVSKGKTRQQPRKKTRRWQKRRCLYCRPVLLKHSALCGGFSPAQKTGLSATALKNTPLLRPPWSTLHPCSESQPQRIPAPPSLANAPQSPLALSPDEGPALSSSKGRMATPWVNMITPIHPPPSLPKRRGVGGDEFLQSSIFNLQFESPFFLPS
jgi:hypothetical protein